MIETDGLVKKFKNKAHKTKVVLSVFNRGEKLTAQEIARRLRRLGYDINPRHLAMFIFYEMQHKYIRVEKDGKRCLYLLN
ncbi:MAG: hypothetical protein DRO01_04715 [Thermoproteota archaeon]|nr:MAG: hypothetical protein DRO01_04715 [Candidatus Korarchaeota archaeon]